MVAWEGCGGDGDDDDDDDGPSARGSAWLISWYE